MRTEKAPGHLDERAEAFDAALGASLRAGRPAVDVDLARELWASVDAMVELGELDDDLGAAQVDYDDTPYGVQYWVMRSRRWWRRRRRPRPSDVGGSPTV